MMPPDFFGPLCPAEVLGRCSPGPNPLSSRHLAGAAGQPPSREPQVKRDGWAQGPSAEAASYKAFHSRRLKGTLGVVYQIIFAVVSFSGEATGQTGMYDLVLPVSN